MPRMKRVEFEGAYYHVMARGNQQSDIVWDEEDCERFVKTLAEVVEQTGWEVMAWALMSNHYHLVIRTPEANLVKGMTWFQNTITKRHIGKYKEAGHLFAGRYKAILVQEGTYLRRLIHYVNLNPIRAGIHSLDLNEAMSYEWSSLWEYLYPPSQRNVFTHISKGYEVFGIRDEKRGREKFWKQTCQAAGKEKESYLEMVKHGWIMGSAEFIAKMSEKLKLTKADIKNGYGGGQLKSQGEILARQIIKEGLEYYGLRQEDLENLKKNDWRKAELAIQIRAKTTMNADWIGKELYMGARGSITNAIKKYRDEREYENG